MIQDEASAVVKNKSDAKGSADKRCKMKRGTKTKKCKANVDSIAVKRCKEIGAI